MTDRKRKRGQAPYIPPETFERVLTAQAGANALRDRAILLTSYFTGMRAIELANLKIGDVWDTNDGIRRVVRLFKTKGDKPREVPLSSRVRTILAEYLATRPQRATLPLFLSQMGGGFSPDSLQQCIARLYRKADVKATSHSGRRSFATRLIHKRHDIKTVQVLLGHESIVTTQNYIYTSPERMQQAVDSLEEDD